MNLSLVTMALILMGVLGALLGLGLAIASRFFHVETDSRVEAVNAALPGINCGACGFPGCEGYAKAVVAGQAAPNLCVPGGHKTSLAVAHIMGMTLADESLAKRAVVHCQGGTDKCDTRYEYAGIADCRAAHLVQAGPKKCEYGCLGFGTCAEACPFGAIAMGEDRIPVVDWNKCTGCGACVRACPRNLCEVLPINIPHYVACSSQDKGKAVKDACSVGCISCWICVKVSPEGSIEKNNNLPRLTYPEGVSYDAAMQKCPPKCYLKVTPPSVTPYDQRAPQVLAKKPAAATAGVG